MVEDTAVILSTDMDQDFSRTTHQELRRQLFPGSYWVRIIHNGVTIRHNITVDNQPIFLTFDTNALRITQSFADMDSPEEPQPTHYGIF